MMRDTSIKTSIDQVIGEEPWMTEELVKKMARPPQKQKKQKFAQGLVPLAAALSITVLGGIVFMTQSDPAAPSTEQIESFTPGELNWQQIEAALIDDDMEAAFKAYLSAILDEDYETLEQVSTTQLTASPKELFDRYQQIDLSTFRIVSVNTSKGEPVTVVQAAFAYKGEENELLQTYVIDASNGEQITVSEIIYNELPVYTPFVFPEKIDLTYQQMPEIPIFEATVPEELVHTRVPLNDSANVVITQSEERMYEYWVEQGNDWYYLMIISLPEEAALEVSKFWSEENDAEGFELVTGGHGALGTIFIEDDQDVYFIGPVPNTEHHVLDIDKNGTDEVLMLRGGVGEMMMIPEGAELVRYRDGIFEGAYIPVQKSVGDFSPQSFVYQFDSSTNKLHITADFKEGETQATYTFTSIDELVKE